MNFLDQICQHAEWVRPSICEKHLIVIEFESVVPANLIIYSRARILLRWPLTYFAYAILYIFSAKWPRMTQIFWLLQAENLNRHSLEVEGISLRHVDNVDSDFGAFHSILNSKVEPLEVACCIRIWPQKHVITVLLLAFYNGIQVSTFKVSIERKKTVLFILRYFVIYCLAFWIHARVITLHILLFWIPWSKYLLKQAVVIVLAACMVLGKIESITTCAILKRLVRKGLMHLVRVVVTALLVHENVRQGHLRVTWNPAKVVDVHPVIHKVKVQGYWRVARLDLRLPSELHIGHHALTRFDKRQRRVLDICSWLNYYFLIRITIVTILVLSQVLLVPRVF